MTFSPRWFVATAAIAVLATSALAQHVADVTGKWAFSVVTPNGTGTPTVVLKQEGEKLTGTYESSRMGVRPLEGTVKKDVIDFVLKGGEVELRFTGTIVDNDNLKGELDMAGQGTAPFTAKRVK
jgi:hypothetical protein